jgi:uncharacterized repeat protein (TIGR01451 family)
MTRIPSRVRLIWRLAAVAAALGVFVLLPLATAEAQEADLGITKSAPATAAAGTDITYTLSVVNLGPDDAATAAVSDPIPAGLTFVSVSAPAGWGCTTPGVGAGGTVTCATGLFAAGNNPVFTLVVHIPAGTPPGTTFTNIATVTSATFDPNDENNSSTAVTTTPPPPQADLSMIKTGPDLAVANTDITYTLTAANSGPDAASSATVTDTLPGNLTFVSVTAPPAWSCTTPAVGAGGTVSCSVGSFAAGGNAVFTLTAHIPAGTASGTTYNNQATISSSTADPTPENNTGIAGTTVVTPTPDFEIAKTHSGNAFQGQTGFTYTLTVSNVGTGPGSGTVTVSDTLPAGLTATAFGGPGWTNCTLGATPTCDRTDVLAAGAAYPPITLTVNVATNSPQTVINTATVSNGGDTNPVNDSVSDPTAVAAPDLAIAKTHATNAFQGQTGFTYTITVSNVGMAASFGTVTVSDTLPAGLTATGFGGSGWNNCTLGATPTCDRTDALAGGASYPPITLTVNVAVGAPSTVTNTATVSGGNDSNPGNNSASDPTSVTTGPEPDLAIAKTHSGNARQGQTGFTYTITVTNVGSAATTGTVTVTDTVPAGLTATAISGAGWSCTVGATSTCTRSNAVASGAAYPPITLTVNVAGNAPGAVTNTASVSGGGETITANNSASDPTIVTAGAAPDLAIAKTHSGSARQGQVGFTYTITVSNVGGSATSGAVSVSDPLPAGLTATAHRDRRRRRRRLGDQHGDRLRRWRHQRGQQHGERPDRGADPSGSHEGSRRRRARQRADRDRAKICQLADIELQPAPGEPARRERRRRPAGHPIRFDRRRPLPAADVRQSVPALPVARQPKR